MQFQCPFRNRISWYKKKDGASTMYAMSTQINPSLPPELKFRLKVTGNYNVGEYHLSIYDVRKSDEGNYECSQSGTTASNQQRLTVISKYRGLFNYTSLIIIDNAYAYILN